MRNYFYLLSCSFLFFLLSACERKAANPLVLYDEIDWMKPQTNTLTDFEKAKGWQLLFDGHSGKNWHGYNLQTFPDCWQIEDSCLTMKNVGGAEQTQDLISDKEYASFALSLEYKLEAGANSGILFQVKEAPRYTYAYETGPEFQVIDHENWPDQLDDWQINGSNYAMYPPLAKPYKPLGEWNRLMLVVDGNEVTQILNGKIVVKYTKYSTEWTQLRQSGKWADYPDYGKFEQGHISLQNHGTKVWYRNILLKKL
ncbi:MAG: DUF1080 domain-containing protein [Tannerellaceae bacterium]|jgi:hypothetical protein|nr:DUF1080 domain-containing protein [Tannerellaceae bacterium]